jgi:hypothetical protein
MEAFMDWSLVWRSQHELVMLVDAVPMADVGCFSSRVDSTNSIAYLQIWRH